MTPTKILSAALLALLACSAADAAFEWKLKSGETLVGEELSQSENTVIIKLPYGKLELDASQIESKKEIAAIDKNSLVTSQAAKVATASEDVTSAATAAATASLSEKNANLKTDAAQKSPAKKSAGAITYRSTDMSRLIVNRPSPQLETTTLDALDVDLLKDAEWVKDYKDFMESILPEDFFLRFRIGYANVITNADKSALDMGLSIEKTWNDVHKLFLYGFYNYAKEYYKSANFTNISVNKYGAGGEYSYDFLGSESGLFVLTAMDYKTDNIKFIDVMTDNMVGIGYNFKMLNPYGVDFEIAMGPGVRYSQYTASQMIQGNDTYFMGYVRQSLTWRISKSFRLEQRFIYALDLAHLDSFDQLTDEYYEKSTYVSVGLVYSPTDVFNIALRYYYDFDAENNLYKDLKNSYAEDSRFMISFEIPIGWKK